MSHNGDESIGLSEGSVILYLDAIVRGVLKKRPGTLDELVEQIKAEYEYDLSALNPPEICSIEVPELHEALLRLLAYHLQNPSELSVPPS